MDRGGSAAPRSETDRESTGIISTTDVEKMCYAKPCDLTKPLAVIGTHVSGAVLCWSLLLPHPLDSADEGVERGVGVGLALIAE
jgi:hypothetical protein